MKQYAKICPKCKSLDIEVRWQSLWFFGLPATYKCMNCGYTGSIFPEVVMNKRKNKNGRRKRNK